jgi:hypothetical protein
MGSYLDYFRNKTCDAKLNKSFKEIHDWIIQKKNSDPTWKLPANTIAFLAGMEEDLVELSNQLGVDLAIVLVIPK